MSDRLFLRLEEDALHGPEAGVPAGTLRAFEPCAALQPYVGKLLLYRETFAGEVVEHVLPDGAMRLVLNLGDAPSTRDDGQGLAAGVLGAAATPAKVRLQGRVHAFSIDLKPGAANALLGTPAGEFGAEGVSLQELWGRAGELLLDQIAQAPDDAARAGILQAALRRRLPDAPAPAPLATHALALAARSEGRGSLRELAAQAGCSERRLQQLFHAHVGLPPRTWRRLLRLHACLRRLRGLRTTPTWAALADECGFYDQSHLVNEFQALCGMTPVEYWRTAIAGSSKTAG